MTQAQARELLQPGDCLLYKPSSFFGYAIAVKTFTWISHVEVYRGGGMSWASRDGLGVNLYPLRLDGLALARRPAAFDATQASSYFHLVQGQKYDWLALLCFTLAVRRGDSKRQICSEFALNMYRHARVYVLSELCDAERTAPAEFVQTPALVTVWRAKGRL